MTLKRNYKAMSVISKQFELIEMSNKKIGFKHFLNLQMSRMQECSQVIQSTVEVLLRQITNALLLYNGILYTGLDRWVILALTNIILMMQWGGVEGGKERGEGRRGREGRLRGEINWRKKRACFYV